MMTQCSRWASCAKRHMVPHLCPTSSARPSPHYLLLNASKSAWINISGRNGSMTWRTYNGANFYTRLLLWRISSYPRNLLYASRLLWKRSPRPRGDSESEGCCPRYKISSLKDSSPQTLDLSRKLFVAARRHTSHPVDVLRWKTKEGSIYTT